MKKCQISIQTILEEQKRLSLTFWFLYQKRKKIQTTTKGEKDQFYKSLPIIHLLLFSSLGRTLVTFSFCSRIVTCGRRWNRVRVTSWFRAKISVAKITNARNNVKVFVDFGIHR